MANSVWNVVIAMKVKGQEWNISLTSDEQSVLTMLRNGYGFFEAQIKSIVETSSGQRPAGVSNEQKEIYEFSRGML